MATPTALTRPAKTEAAAGGFNWGLGLTVVSGIFMVIALYMALAWAPDALNLEAPAERYAQRIFYFHVPSAWIGFLAFIVAAVTAVLYLATRNPRWDIWGLASVEVGLAFFTMVMLSGPIWAKPTWNVWWTWDPRLTISTISWLLYIGYLMLRGAVDNPERQARFAAVYALIAAISVPINWMAIRWWRTIHPAVVAPGKSSDAMGGFGMSDSIMLTLMFCLVAFTVFYITLMYHRIRLENLKRRVDAVKQEILYR
ncbi:MAG: cytochrome c biogenesis protein CcsA [Anaerolineales bacterium]|nr:cytochrome c biogenesis protein CcsA [Anaerolineales bacterium]